MVKKKIIELLSEPLENDIVRLYPLKESHWNKLFDVASDSEIWAQHPKRDRWKEEVFRGFFNDAIASRLAFVAFDNVSGDCIGSSRYNIRKPESKIVEIGWSFLAKSHWGGKYNMAMKTLMVQHAYQFMNYVILCIDEKNIRSCKAAEKIGAELITDSTHPAYDKRPHYQTYLIPRRIVL